MPWLLWKELCRGQVAQRRMRLPLVVMLPPLFDHDTRLGAIAEVLDGQTFVSEFAVEALVGAVRCRLSWGSVMVSPLRLRWLVRLPAAS